MEKQLPKNWVETDLFTISNVSTGKKDANHAKDDGEYIFYTCALEQTKSPTYSFEGSSIIIPGNGNIGYVFYYEGKFEAYQRTYVINDIRIDPKYLFYHFKCFWKSRTVDNLFGSTIQYVKIGNFKSYSVEIPPLPEQHRIVAKLDTLFSQLETIKTNMDNIPLLLKDFHQQVLTQAVTGKLTEEWRKEKKLKAWKNVELKEVIPKGGIFDGPFGSNLKTEDYTDRGVRVIRLENIEHINFIADKETYVSDEKHQKLIRHTVFEGDIIFSSFISENIRACILPKLETKAIAKADCFCIRPDETIIDKKFLLYILVSNITYSQLTSHIHGATRPRVNTTQLKTITIPLVSLKEQLEIVNRVEILFAKADAIEQQYKSLKEKIDTLPQALLHKAFKGGLSEQIDGDGDATALLKEIQALRTKTVVVGKKKVVEKKVKEYMEEKGDLGMVAEVNSDFKILNR